MNPILYYYFNILTEPKDIMATQIKTTDCSHTSLFQILQSKHAPDHILYNHKYPNWFKQNIPIEDSKQTIQKDAANKKNPRKRARHYHKFLFFNNKRR